MFGHRTYVTGRAGCNDGNQVREQSFAGPHRWRFDKMDGRGPIDHPTDERQDDGGYRVGAVGRRDERKIDEQVIQQQRPCGSDLVLGRFGGDFRHGERRVGKQPEAIRL